jgi:hypothetical protein
VGRCVGLFRSVLNEGWGEGGLMGLSGYGYFGSVREVFG